MANSCNGAWGKISPSWPLKNVIACNPLKGFEDLNFKDAVSEGFRFFEKGSVSGDSHSSVVRLLCSIVIDATFTLARGRAPARVPHMLTTFRCFFGDCTTIEGTGLIEAFCY